MSFVVDGRIQAATLPQMTRRLAARRSIGRCLCDIMLGDNEYVALSRPISALDSDAPVLGRVVRQPLERRACHAQRVVILRSRTESLRFLNSVHTMLAATALAGRARRRGPELCRGADRDAAARRDHAAMREMAATGDLTRKLTLPAGGRLGR